MATVKAGIVIPNASLQSATVSGPSPTFTLVGGGIKIAVRFEITIPTVHVKGLDFDPAVDFPGDPNGLNHVYIEGGLPISAGVIAGFEIFEPSVGDKPVDVKIPFRLFGGKTRWDSTQAEPIAQPTPSEVSSLLASTPSSGGNENGNGKEKQPDDKRTYDNTPN